MRSLPNDIVEMIFTRMSVAYGAAWAQMWAGVGDLSMVKAQWATELAGYANNVDAIKHALDHLPVDWPPNSLQFRVICMGAPERLRDPAPQLPGMPEKKADITRLNAAMERYEELAKERAKNPKQWAQDLKEREERGERLTEFEQNAWRRALRVIGLTTMAGDFKPVPFDALPPDMQRTPQ